MRVMVVESPETGHETQTPETRTARRARVGVYCSRSPLTARMLEVMGEEHDVVPLTDPEEAPTTVLDTDLDALLVLEPSEDFCTKAIAETGLSLPVVIIDSEAEGIQQQPRVHAEQAITSGVPVTQLGTHGLTDSVIVDRAVAVVDRQAAAYRMW